MQDEETPTTPIVGTSEQAAPPSRPVFRLARAVSMSVGPARDAELIADADALDARLAAAETRVRELEIQEAETRGRSARNVMRAINAELLREDDQHVVSDLRAEVAALREQVAKFEAEPVAAYGVALVDYDGSTWVYDIYPVSPCYQIATPEGTFAGFNSRLDELAEHQRRRSAKWGDCRIVALHARPVREEVAK